MLSLRSILILSALCALLIPAFVRGTEFEGLGDELEEETAEGEVDAEVPEGIPKKVTRVIYQAEIDSEDEARTEGQQKPEPGGVSLGSHSPSEKMPSKQPVRDDWDEDEFEGIDQGYPDEGTPAPGAKPGQQQHQHQQQQPTKTVRVVQPRKPMKAKDHIPELIFLGFLAIFAINYFLGSSRNEKIALAWAEEFASAGSIFEKNFSLLGTGESNDDKEPLMIKDGQGVFKFYASGRRFCECALATIDLRSRQDLLSLLWYLIFPKKDRVKIEIHMNDDNMQPFILAVVRRKMAKAYLKENRDLKQYCGILDYSHVQKKWPGDELAVISDSREAVTELLNDGILDQLLGEKAFEKNVKQHFVSLHFTDQGPGPLKKKILRFEFTLPALNKMADLTKLIASVPYFIDAVARFTLSSNAKAKAEAARTKAQAAAMKELQEQKQEELQRRREEKKKAEEAKMTPQELARRREKERKKDMKPKKMMRIH